MRLTYVLFLTICVYSFSLSAQTGSEKIVAGVIMDQNGNELTAVNVVSKKKGTGTITNNEGYFKLEVEAPDTIVFMFMGMRTRELPVTKSSEAIQIINVMLQSSSVVLKEVEVSPFLSPDDLSYDKLPMDATESTRYQLRQHAKYTNKTYFETVGFNFAPFLIGQAGKLGKRIKKIKDKDVQQRIKQMKQDYKQRGDSIFMDTIPIETMPHPSRSIFKK